MSGINSVSGRADINQVLSEMRNLRAQMQRPESIQPEMSPTQIRGSQPTVEAKDAPSFSDMLTKAVDSVNEVQQQSASMAKAYEMGDPNVSISQVMVQAQKSSVSFQALVQVRNKVVKAYEDIMNMPV